MKNYWASLTNKEVETVYPLVRLFNSASMASVAAIYFLFLLDNGLNAFQASLVSATFMTATFLFEVPTGAVADIFGRKISVIFGFSIRVVGAFAYFLSGSIAGFIAAEIIFAIGNTMVSGALQSWAYDNMKNPDNFKALESKAQSAFSIAPLISAPIGGIIAAHTSLRMPWLVLTITGFLTVLFAIIFMRSDREQFTKKGKDISQKGSQLFMSITKQGFSQIMNSRNLKVIGITAALMYFTFQPLNMFWTVILNNKFSLGEDKIGIFFSVVAISLTLGSMIAGQEYLKKYSQRLQLSIATAVIGISIAIAANSDILILFATGFIIHEIARGFIMPTRSAIINRDCPKEIRATVNSIDSMLKMIGAALGLILFGWIATNYSIKTSWIISGGILIIIALLYLFYQEEEQPTPHKMEH